jgi:hypothetical protein
VDGENSGRLMLKKILSVLSGGLGLGEEIIK